MAENEEVKTSRDLYLERLRAKYPDKEYADDEALFAQINEDYDGYDKSLEEIRAREKAIADMYVSDPRTASFMLAWRDGNDPFVEFVRRFGGEFKESLEDPEKQEAFAEANKEYAERVAKSKEYEELYEKNMAGTLATLEQVQQEDGLTDEQVNAAMEFLIGVMKDALLGKFTADGVRMALKAINHDADVAEAEHEGEVRGRNAKIDEKLRKRSGGDGVASLAGKNGGTGANRRKSDFAFFDLAAEAQ